MTSGGEHARVLDAVPRDLAGMIRVVQGLLLHEHWAPAYGVRLSAERKSQCHIRPGSLMLDRVPATVFNKVLNRSETVEVGR
jgi:hypothetical protein